MGVLGSIPVYDTLGVFGYIYPVLPNSQVRYPGTAEYIQTNPSTILNARYLYPSKLTLAVRGSIIEYDILEALAHIPSIARKSGSVPGCGGRHTLDFGRCPPAYYLGHSFGVALAFSSDVPLTYL